MTLRDCSPQNQQGMHNYLFIFILSLLEDSLVLNKRCSVSTRVLQVSCALCMDVFVCQSLSCCQKWPDALKEINGIPFLDF